MNDKHGQYNSKVNFHSKESHTITKMNDNIRVDITVAGPKNTRS